MVDQIIIKVRELITLKTPSYETVYEDREIEISQVDLARLKEEMDWDFWTDNLDMDQYEDAGLRIHYELSDPDSGEALVSAVTEEADLVKALRDQS